MHTDGAQSASGKLLSSRQPLKQTNKITENNDEKNSKIRNTDH